MIMPLELLVFQQDLPDPFPVSCMFEIFIFRPGKEGGIIRDMHLETAIAVIVHHKIKIIQTLDAGEAPGGIPAKKGHETGIPDPDLVTADAFIHIGGYRSFAAGKNMGPSRLPCGIIKCNKIRVFLIDGSRDKVFRHETLSCREKRDDFFGFPVGISGN